MSAYVVEDKTINRVISFLVMNRGSDHLRTMLQSETGADLLTQEGKEALGKAMFDLNCNAVEQRYGEGEAKESRDLNYQVGHELTNLLQAYKSLRCWLYQCSEGDVPEASLLYAAMNRVSDGLAHQIVSDLKAYEAAEWD